MTLDDTAEQLERDLKDAVETIESLTKRLEDSDQELSRAYEDIELLLDHVNTIEEKGADAK